MRHLLQLLPVAIVFVGCASAPNAKVTADNSKHRTQIQRRLLEIFDAAEKKDLDRLDSYHLYGPKFTKFAPEAVGRLDAAAARKGEHDGLAPVSDLKMQAEDLKIDVFGDAAVATFVMNYTFKAGGEAFQKQALSTLVFVKDHGAWRITHEHFSPVKSSP